MNAPEKIPAQAIEDAKAEAGSEIPETGSQAHAEVFMLGNLLNACMKRFKTTAVTWQQMNEIEQTNFLRSLTGDIRKEVHNAVNIIACHGRITFRAEVKDVNFKGGDKVEAKLNLIPSDEAHSLADVAGDYVTVVIEELDELLAIDDSDMLGEPDQGALFDKSGGDQMGDPEPELNPDEEPDFE